MKKVSNLSKLFMFLTLLVSFLIAGCQKNNESSTLEETVTQNNQDLAFCTSVLQLVYGISDETLNHPSSEKIYKERMEYLDEEKLSELKKLVAVFQNKSQSEGADCGNAGVRRTGNKRQLQLSCRTNITL